MQTNSLAPSFGARHHPAKAEGVGTDQGASSASSASIASPDKALTRPPQQDPDGTIRDGKSGSHSSGQLTDRHPRLAEHSTRPAEGEVAPGVDALVTRSGVAKFLNDIHAEYFKACGTSTPQGSLSDLVAKKSAEHIAKWSMTASQRSDFLWQVDDCIRCYFTRPSDPVTK